MALCLRPIAVNVIQAAKHEMNIVQIRPFSLLVVSVLAAAWPSRKTDALSRGEQNNHPRRSFN
jgi:hypothetical protein